MKPPLAEGAPVPAGAMHAGVTETVTLAVVTTPVRISGPEFWRTVTVYVVLLIGQTTCGPGPDGSPWSHEYRYSPVPPEASARTATHWPGHTVVVVVATITVIGASFAALTVITELAPETEAPPADGAAARSGSSVLRTQAAATSAVTAALNETVALRLLIAAPPRATGLHSSADHAE